MVLTLIKTKQMSRTHFFGTLHLKEIIIIKIKNITPVVYPECVLKVGDSSHFSM